MRCGTVLLCFPTCVSYHSFLYLLVWRYQYKLITLLYEAANREKNPSALIVNKNFTDYVGNFKKYSDRFFSCKIKLQGKYHYKLYKFMPLQVTMMIKKCGEVQQTI